jgi:hypothetical protein
LNVFGTPVVVELWPGQLSGDAASLPLRQFDQHVGLWPDWEQIGNNIGNVSPMRPQCENTKVASC